MSLDEKDTSREKVRERERGRSSENENDDGPSAVLSRAKVTSLVYTPGRGTGRGNVDFTRESDCTRVHLFLSRLGYLGPAKDPRPMQGRREGEERRKEEIKGEREKTRRERRRGRGFLAGKI